MFLRILAVLLVGVFMPVIAAASEPYRGASFIQQRALGPIKLLTGLPEAASRLNTPSELQLGLVHNNVFMGGRVNSERLLLDGESTQLNLRYKQRINRCWQVNASTMLIGHSGGWFDQSLDDWHQFFGLPDAQRGDWPVNQLEYVYENSEKKQSLTTDSRGLADAQLQVQRSLGCLPNSALMRVGIKLPFGDSSQLLSDAGVSAFVDVQSPWQRSSKFSRIQWAASLGLLAAGHSELLVEREPVAAFGVLGMNVDLSLRSQLMLQLDWHSPLFKSELRELGDLAAQVSLGMRYQTRRAGTWEFSFSEDAVVDTVPDIVIRLAWVSRFDAKRLLHHTR